jgi:uncharacterized protein (TIGR03083 family)
MRDPDAGNERISVNDDGSQPRTCRADLALPWDRLVGAFDDSGARARAVLASEAVHRAWSAESILPRITVGAVAGHLLAVVLMFDRGLDTEVSGPAAQVDLASGYDVIRLDDAGGLDDDPFRIPRSGGEHLAERGHSDVVETFRSSLEGVVARLRRESPERPILVGNHSSASTLRAYTVTRLVEVVVHADDLAESVGAAIPPPHGDAADVVIDFLFASVQYRLGPAATIRSLAGRASADDLRAL